MDQPQRIVSLLPAATEIVAALGLGDRLVGRSHECDEPPTVTTLPALTAPRVDPTTSSREIHEQVGAAADALFALDIDRFAALRPDLVITQAACKVCAIAADDVAAAVRTSGVPARVLSLSPATLDEVLHDILTVGAATGTLATAREVVARLRARCDSVRHRIMALQGRVRARPTVAVVEWLDPPMAAGNWVPELVRIAGGTDVLGKDGGHSHWTAWEDVAAADPDVLVLIPCGFTLDRVIEEARSAAVWPHVERLRAFRDGRAWAVDGHHLFNRPGPRLVDSLEALAETLQPGGFSFPVTKRFARNLGQASA
jgi:iron complex transport system substrate-binding protein